MPVHDPALQRAERRRVAAGLTRVAVDLNDTRLRAAEAFIAADAGIGRSLDLPMLLLRALDDYVGLNRPQPLMPLAADRRWEQ